MQACKYMYNALGFTSTYSLLVAEEDATDSDWSLLVIRLGSVVTLSLSPRTGKFSCMTPM